MEMNGLNESSAQFCMICLDTHSKLYPASKHNLDMEYESLTGILLAEVFSFTPMFCSECANRLNNCCKFRDKSLRAFQLLSELVQSNAVLSPQTLSLVDRARCRLTSSVVKKTFEPNHCDLYVKEDTDSINKLNMKNEEIDSHRNLYLKCETDCDLELKSGDICDDAAEFTADDVNTDVEITNDDAKDVVNVVYIDDSSNDNLYNHEDNMHGVEQSNTNKSHENQRKILNHNKTTAVTNADAEWLNDMDDDIDIDFDINEDIQHAANDVNRRDGNMKKPTYANINDNNKDVLKKNADASKFIDVTGDNVNKVRVIDDEIGVISLDDDINQAVVNNNEYDNYVRFVNENLCNQDKVNDSKTIGNIVSLNNVMLVRESDMRSISKGTNANATHVLVNKTKSNDVNNIVSQNNVILVRETDKRSVSNGTHGSTHVSVKKRAAKRKQPQSDKKEPQRTRSRKKIMQPEKKEEPKYKNIKWFRRIERSPEEQVADWTQRQESDRYRGAPYKCTDCYKGFRVEKTYNLHLEKHTDKYGAVECHICRVRVRSRHALMKHLRATHKFLYRCTECVFVTTSAETANSHSRWHDGKTYECPHCGKVFMKPTSYYTHVRLAHPSDAVCALCGYSFVGKQGLWLHQRKAHRDYTQELSGPQCEQCDVRFANEAAYETHLQVTPKHGATGGLKRNDPSNGMLGKSELPRKEVTRRRQTHKICIINCELCNAVLENRNKYYWHLRNYHPDSVTTKRDFMCEQCGKLCASNFHLQEHKLSKHDKTKVQCDACDKKFYSLYALRLHVLRIHKAAQRRGDTYVCAHCAYQTKERGNLVRHMQVHLDSNARRWFHCTLCEKKTTTKKAIQDHVLHVHQNVPWPARVRASRTRAAVPRTRATDSSES